ncbi:MAG: MYXO-CTERM sorting domain-containing protein, partial [Myxococcota bacterium]
DADSDDDGLNDGDEVNIHDTDPNDADSDDGGVNDGDEIANGTDPNFYDDDLAQLYFAGGRRGCATTSGGGDAPLAIVLSLLGLAMLRRRRSRAA